MPEAHDVQEVEPIPEDQEPDIQKIQELIEVAAVIDEYVPALQNEHEVAPEEDHVPGGQLTQASVDVAATVDE